MTIEWSATSSRSGGGIELTWTASGTAAGYFAIYRADGAGCGIEAGRNLIVVRRTGSGTQRFTDTAPPPVGQVTYLVTAVSRIHHESSFASATVTG